MRVLMISTDRGIFEENSEVRRRMIEYGGLADELHIIVFSKKGFEKQNFGNIFLYPTNSRSRWFYVCDASRIGVKIKNINLVTTQDPFEVGLAGWLIARKLKLPVHIQIHTDFLSPYFQKDSLLNRARVLIAKFLIPRASCIRVVSKRIKKTLQTKKYKLKTEPTVLPVFVDIQRIKNAPVKTSLRQKYPQFDFIVLMASRLTKEKNIGMAISVFAEVVERFPKVGLIIVGAGPESKALKTQIAKRKLENSVILEEWTDDLASYYKSADLFLLTSDYEGYGRTVMEAMAANCPVIMTDVGLAGEVIRHNYNGLVVPVNDKEKLKESILKMMSEGSARASVVLSAERTLADFGDKAEYLAEYKKTWEHCSS